MAGVFEKVLWMNSAACFVILAVFLVRILLRKAPKKYICLLWFLVGVRLVVPFSIESRFSLVPGPDMIGYIDAPKDVYNVSAENIFSDSNVLTNADINYADDFNYTDISSDEQNLKAWPSEYENFIFTWKDRLAWVWLAGVAVMFAYFFGSFIILKKRLRTAVRYEGNVWQSENVDSPFLFGLLFPRIYIPYGMEVGLEHVLLHERTHLKRRDNWTKAAAFLLLSIHWFNPLLWAAYLVLCKDIEMACDEAVILGMNEAGRREYLLALLYCRGSRRIYNTCPIGFGEIDVKERVVRIKAYKKASFWVILILLVFSGVILICFMTNRKTPSVKDEPEALYGEIVNSLEEENKKGQKEQEEQEEQEALKDLNEYRSEIQGEIRGQEFGFGNSGSIESLILKAIIEHNFKAVSPNQREYPTADFWLLGVESTIPLNTANNDSGYEYTSYYGWAYYMTALVGEDFIYEADASHLPIVISFKRDVITGALEITEYWEPDGDGSDYVNSIKERFPETVAGQGLNSQSYITLQKMSCYAKILKQTGNSATAAIEKCLENICEPDISSNPGDYIGKHIKDYRELLYYGEYTLSYREEYEREHDDLKSKVLDIACEEILYNSTLHFNDNKDIIL